MKLLRLVSRIAVFMLAAGCLVLGKRNKVIYCGACLALLEEMDWELSQTDSKKTIQVGSFRIDSRGKQDLNTIPLKRSELHLMELLENSCDQVDRYSERIVPDSGKSNFIRQNSRDGTRVSQKHMQNDEHARKVLKFACDTLVEEHEETIIDMYKDETEDVPTKLCVEMAEVCNAGNITEQREAMQQALSDAVREEADRAAARITAAAQQQEDGEEEDQGQDEEEDDDDGNSDEDENSDESADHGEDKKSDDQSDDRTNSADSANKEEL